jgi:hypothetical protein
MIYSQINCQTYMCGVLKQLPQELDSQSWFLSISGGILEAVSHGLLEV